MGNGLLLLTLVLTSLAWTVIVLGLASAGGRELPPGSSVGGCFLGLIGGFFTTALIWSFMG